ncbi:MFS transporter [Planomonospora sp. ID67723]|uniref:MFS transporter n=1 Tax=Planomonospora sp. ID67723 TaxID=2738134 RepID=UPI0018C3EF5A|nr:MFS transporter [Planomonospora sp. ID67723]MBG0829115.1 MFS transporter [Planomonospora sp. ID67723]
MDVNTPAKAGTREWLALAILALPTLLLSIDMSVLYLALPHLSSELGATLTQQLWITDIYGFVIAGLLVTMGRLGDLIGRRRLLLVGATAFTVASVLAAYSSTAELLIVSRALLGIAGATIMPSTMSLIVTIFKDPQQMGTAISVWMACFMGGIALGPVVGGLMLENFWWGSVFLLAVPVMALLLATGPVLLPEHRDPDGGRLDLPSVALSLAAILPFIYGLKELAKHGWQPWYVVAVLAGLAFGLAFVQRQRKLESPLLDMRLFKRPIFRAAVAIMVLGGVVNGSFFLVSMFLQTVVGLSPLATGLWVVPSTAATIASVLLAPVVARKLRPGYVIAGGLVVIAIGYFVLSTLDVSSGVGLVLTGLVIGSVGAGPMGALGNALIFSSVPPEQAGSASAVSETGGELGIALGVATLGSVGTAVYSAQISGALPSSLPPAVADTAGEGIAGAINAAGQVSAPVAAELLTAAREAFTTSVTAATGVSAVLALCLAVFALITLRKVPPTGQQEQTAEESAEEPESANA